MKNLKITFIALIIVFLFIVAQIFIPAVTDLFRGTLLFLGPAIILFLLSCLLIFLTFKLKLKGKLKKFLLLTGASAAGFFVFSVLHNVFYALGILSSNIPVLVNLMEILHVLSFIIAILVCPICFLIGLIGSSILLRNS